jgi:hypothetical protein
MSRNKIKTLADLQTSDEARAEVEAAQNTVTPATSQDVEVKQEPEPTSEPKAEVKQETNVKPVLRKFLKFK